jgi:hypothetical protein
MPPVVVHRCAGMSRWSARGAIYRPCRRFTIADVDEPWYCRHHADQAAVPECDVHDWTPWDVTFDGSTYTLARDCLVGGARETDE